jgi:hypothetical protein
MKKLLKLLGLSSAVVLLFSAGSLAQKPKGKKQESKTQAELRCEKGDALILDIYMMRV